MSRSFAPKFLLVLCATNIATVTAFSLQPQARQQQNQYVAFSRVVRGSVATSRSEEFHEDDSSPMDETSSYFDENEEDFYNGMDFEDYDDDVMSIEVDQNTVECIVTPAGGSVTLIGTSHISKNSSDQVKYIIEAIRPNAVALELDGRQLLGMAANFRENTESMNYSLGSDLVHSDSNNSQQVLSQPSESKKKRWWSRLRRSSDMHSDSNSQQVLSQPSESKKKRWWSRLRMFLRKKMLIVLSNFWQRLLGSSYHELFESLDHIGQSEFEAAYNASMEFGVPKVLSMDRPKEVTFYRTLDLMFQSGRPWRSYNRIVDIVDEETQEIRDKISHDMSMAVGGEYDDDDDGIKKEAIALFELGEALKADPELRNRILDRWEEEVPGFTKTFIKERDLFMAKAIQRQMKLGAHNVVGVVGLAHVRGMTEYLMAMDLSPECDSEVSTSVSQNEPERRNQRLSRGFYEYVWPT